MKMCNLSQYLSYNNNVIKLKKGCSLLLYWKKQVNE